MIPNDLSYQQAHNLLNFVDTSPSPWHAVESMEKMLMPEGFIRLDESKPW